MRPVDLQRLAEQVDAEVDARVRDGKCGCGCGAALPVPHRGKGRDRRPIPFEEGRKRFVYESHKQRQYRSKLRRLAEAQGAPAVLSLKTVGAGVTTRDRSGDAPGRSRKRQSKPRKGVSVYFPTVEDALRAQQALAHAKGNNFTAAHQAVDRALERRARRAA